MTHWQHRSFTQEVMDQYQSFPGPSRHHMRLLTWIREQQRPVTSSMTAREFFKDDPVRHFMESRTILEILAIHGYLLRGRSHYKVPKDAKHKPGSDYAFTTYRCSLKTRKLLGKLHDASRSEPDPVRGRLPTKA